MQQGLSNQQPHVLKALCLRLTLVDTGHSNAHLLYVGLSFRCMCMCVSIAFVLVNIWNTNFARVNFQQIKMYWRCNAMFLITRTHLHLPSTLPIQPEGVNRTLGGGTSCAYTPPSIATILAKPAPADVSNKGFQPGTHNSLLAAGSNLWPRARDE